MPQRGLDVRRSSQSRSGSRAAAYSNSGIRAKSRSSGARASCSALAARRYSSGTAREATWRSPPLPSDERGRLPAERGRRAEPGEDGLHRWVPVPQDLIARPGACGHHRGERLFLRLAPPRSQQLVQTQVRVRAACRRKAGGPGSAACGAGPYGGAGTRSPDTVRDGRRWRGCRSPPEITRTPVRHRATGSARTRARQRQAPPCWSADATSQNAPPAETAAPDPLSLTASAATKPAHRPRSRRRNPSLS